MTRKPYDLRDQVEKEVEVRGIQICYYCNNPSVGKYESWGKTHSGSTGYLGVIPLCEDCARKWRNEVEQRQAKVHEQAVKFLIGVDPSNWDSVKG